MDLEEAIRIVAGRMNKRLEAVRDYPTVTLTEQFMAELGCKTSEDIIRKFLENPKQIYEFAFSRLKEMTDPMLGMLFLDIFSRFGVRELVPAYIEAIKKGDREKLKEIFIKLAEAVRKAEET